MKNETFSRIDKGFKGLKSDIENIYDYNGANYIMEKYAFALPAVSKSKYNEFIDVFCNLAKKSDEISFYPLWIMTARRNGVNQISDRDLFDDIPNRNNKIDTDTLNSLILTMGRNVGYSDNLSGKFLDNFSDFIKEKVQTYSLKSKNISELKKSLEQEHPNNKLSESFSKLSVNIENIHKNKRSADIKSLNNWAYKYNLKNADLIKQLSFRSTYINLLYESVVKENDIKDIDIQKYYLQHRLKVHKKVDELTGTQDAKGKLIVRKYAINKVYKSIGAQDKFKHNSLVHSLENLKDQAFYSDAINILTALDGGQKNRDVKMPLPIKTNER